MQRKSKDSYSIVNFLLQLSNHIIYTVKPSNTGSPNTVSPRRPCHHYFPRFSVYCNIPASPLQKGRGRFFQIFRIKGWVENFWGLRGEPNFALQNFKEGGSVLVEKMHTPETKSKHFSGIRDPNFI